MKPSETNKDAEDMDDNQLYYFLKDIMEKRQNNNWSASVDDYGNPSIEAKLAVIKHILCQ